MEERIKKSFETALETVKQLLTLATALIGGIVTVAGASNNSIISFKGPVLYFLFLLGMLVLSIIFGLFSMMNITGHLGNRLVADPTPYAPPIRFFVFLQAVTFAVAMIMLAFSLVKWG